MSSDRAGFGALTTLHYQLSHFRDRSVELDGGDARWIDGNMAAPLGGILELAANRGNKISLIGFQPRVAEPLARNGFLRAFAIDYFNTSIPYKKFDRSEAVVFAEYTEEQLSGRGIPELSQALRVKFLEGLDEIFSNAAIHSQSTAGVFCCGQAYPKSEKIRFTIADCGIGIRKSLRESRGEDMSADQAIDWAMTEGTTARSGDVPGGLGLKILREFIEINKGTIKIVSETGFWQLQGGKVTTHRYFRSYPGTIVTIEINTSDTNSYYLANEIDADKIF